MWLFINNLVNTCLIIMNIIKYNYDLRHRYY